MGITKEQFNQLCQDAQFVPNDQGNLRCPITRSSISRGNCRLEKIEECWGGMLVKNFVSHY
jgi:hypothetical protein